MLYLRILIKVVLWHFVSVASSVSNADQWSDWIIIPARAGTSREKVDLSRNFSDFNVNRRSDVKNFLDSEEMKTYIMRTVRIRDDSKKQPVRVQSETEDFDSSNDIILPLGRAIEKVKMFCSAVKDFFEENFLDADPGPLENSSRKTKKLKKKYKKLIFPLLIAYKLKFLTLIPVLMGGLVLLVGTTGLAGFFFALFTAVMSLKSESKVEVQKW